MANSQNSWTSDKPTKVNYGIFSSYWLLEILPPEELQRHIQSIWEEPRECHSWPERRPKPLWEIYSSPRWASTFLTARSSGYCHRRWQTSCSKLHLIWELTSFASPFKIAPSELSKPRKKEHKQTDKPKDLQTGNRQIQIVKTAPKSKDFTENEVASCFIFPRVQHSLPIKLPPGPPLPSSLHLLLQPCRHQCPTILTRHNSGSFGVKSETEIYQAELESILKITKRRSIKSTLKDVVNQHERSGQKKKKPVESDTIDSSSKSSESSSSSSSSSSDDSSD